MNYVDTSLNQLNVVQQVPVQQPMQIIETQPVIQPPKFELAPEPIKPIIRPNYPVNIKMEPPVLNRAFQPMYPANKGPILPGKQLKMMPVQEVQMVPVKQVEMVPVNEIVPVQGIVNKNQIMVGNNIVPMHQILPVNQGVIEAVPELVVNQAPITGEVISGFPQPLP